MPRHEDRYGSTTRLYVGHFSSRTRTRDLEHVFSRYGRVRNVDMKRDYAFVEFSDPRDADEARYNLDGRDVDGRRIIVAFANGVPRGTGGVREYVGRGPAPGSGRCFNCGIGGHWHEIARLETGRTSAIAVGKEETLKGAAITVLRSSDEVKATHPHLGDHVLREVEGVGVQVSAEVVATAGLDPLREEEKLWSMKKGDRGVLAPAEARWQRGVLLPPKQGSVAQHLMSTAREKDEVFLLIERKWCPRIMGDVQDFNTKVPITCSTELLVL